MTPHLYKFVKKLLLTSMIIGVQSIHVYAQGNVSITPETSASAYASVISNGVFYAVTDASGSQVTLNFEVNTDNRIIEIVTESYYSHTSSTSGNSGRKLLSASISDGKIVVEPVDLTIAGAGIETIDYTINYVYRDTPQSTAQNGTLSGSFRMQFFNKPEAMPLNPMVDEVLSGTSVNLAVDYAGGNTANGGWSFVWSEGSGNGATNTFTPIVSSESDENVSVTVINYAPDRVTRWFEQTFTFPIKVYSTPTFSISPSQNYYSGQTISLVGTPSGGRPDGWNFVWDGGTPTTSAAYQLMAENAGNTPVQKTVHVTASNSNSAGDVWFTGSEEWQMTIYPAPVATLAEPVRTNYIAGENVPFRVNHSGGDETAWTYEWMVDGVPAGTDGSEFIYTAQNSGSSQVEHIISVKVGNKATGVEIPFEQTFSQSVTVWPTPVIESRHDALQSVFSGQDVTIGVSVAGGVSDGWKYHWTVTKNGSAVSSFDGDPELTLSDDVVNTEITEYTLEVSNYAESEIVASQTFTYVINRYTTPEVTFTLPRTNYISGESISLSANASGGDASAWHYSWKDDGREFSTLREASYSAVNVESDRKQINLTLTANNTPANILEPYANTITREIIVWRAPSLLSRSDETISVFSGTSIELSANFEGGNTSGWSYQWKLNNQPLAESGPILSTVVSNGGMTPVVNRYTLTASNECDGVVVFIQDYDFVVTVWPTPTAILPTVYPSNVINGQAVNMGVDVTGGDPSAWTYSWVVDGTTAGTDRTFVYNALNSAYEGSVETTVEVTATNMPDGIDKPYSTKETRTFTVWATPELKSQSGTSQAVFNGTVVDMGIEMQGGVADAWIYSWTLNGQAVGNERTLSVEAINTGTGVRTYDYKVNVVNKCEGADAFNQTYDYMITVWPTPAATLPTVYPANVINGQAVNMGVDVTGGDSSAWTYSWVVDGTTAGTDRTFVYNALNSASEGSVETTVEVTATNMPDGIDKPYSTKETRTFTVWATPELKSQSGTSQSVFNGTVVDMGIEMQGGVADAWTYSWTLNGQAVGNERTLSVEAINTGTGVKTYDYKVNVVNKCEGADAFNQTYDYTITVWPTPAATLPTVYPSNVINGQTVNMGVDVTGGDPSAWTYSWVVDGTTAGTDRTFVYNALNSASEGSVETTVEVTATNTPDGIDKPYSTKETRTFTVWATPELKSQSGTSQAVFNGTVVDMGIEMQGGVADAWIYSWTLNGQAVGNERTLSVEAINTGTGVRTYDYKVNVVNKCEGADAFNQTYDYTITVWPTPAALFSANYPADVISGQGIDMDVTVSGGDPNAWSYLWKVGETPASSNKSYRYIANNPLEDGCLDTTVTLDITNAPSGIDKSYTKTLSHTFTVWAMPSLKRLTGANQTVFAGTEITAGVEMQGGVTDAWTYEWEYEGNVIGNEAVLKIVPEGSGTDTSVTRAYSVTAINVCNGNEVFRQKYDFVITVWPKPTAILSSDYPTDLINGQEIEMEVETVGGDSSAWTYAWTSNGVAVSTEKAFKYQAVNNATDGNRTVTVNVRAINSPADIDNPYSYNGGHNFTVWATPSLKKRTEEKLNLCNGQSKTLSVEMQGGYDAGWTYEWICNDEKLEANGNKLDITGQNDSEVSLTDTYTVKVTNTLNGETVFNETFSFEVTIWPSAEVTMNQKSYPDNVLSGDEVLMSFSYLGGDPEGWSSIWYLDGTDLQNSNTSYTFIGRNDNETQSIESTVELVVDNRPAGALDFSHHFSYNHTFKVWAKPVIKSQLPSEVNTYNGQPVDIGVEVVGGQADGWEFIWTRNGAVVGDGNKAVYSFSAENGTAAMRSDVYHLTVMNKVEGTVRFEQALTFTVNVYPTPSANADNTDFINYYGESVALGVDYNGGNPDGWKFEWSDGSATPFINFLVDASDKDSYSESQRLTVTNSFGDVEWYRETFVFNIDAYSRGTIEAVELASYDFSGQAITELTTEQKGGYPDGWTYRWAVNGEIAGIDGTTIEVTEYNETSEVMKLNYTLVAENRIDGRLGSTTTLTYPTLNIWPVIVMPTEISVSDTKIRQGNTIVLEPSPAPASGGYEYVWEYDWAQDGTPISTDQRLDITARMNVSGNGMSTEKHIYSLQLTNPGPDGTTWASQRYVSPEVTVYRRPVTPTSLEHKGNGTSHTMITMFSGLNDAELESNEYLMVFGYTDSNGEDHFMTPTSKRYIRFDGNVYNNASNTFWVFTIWNYPDRACVTSGRRYLDGSVDENYDASTYDGGGFGRGDHSDIDSVVAENEIFFDGTYFIANVPQRGEAVIDIYNGEGMLVKTLKYDEANEFCEKVDTESLSKGIYVAEIKIGSLRAVRKVVVDYK